MSSALPKGLPSIDDLEPEEQGGPNARRGFNFQDEVGVALLLDMLEDATFLQIHFETHDDLIVKRAIDGIIHAEYLQVKSNQPDQLWSVASLCADGSDSVFCKSLGRDKCQETSRFRIVTLRDVTAELKLLTYPRYCEARKVDSDDFIELSGKVAGKFPKFTSVKGNGAAFWLEHCHWDVRPPETEIRKSNILRILRIAHAQGQLVLAEHAEDIALRLLRWVADASAAKWKPDKAKKIVTRPQMVAWWNAALKDIRDGAKVPSGKNLQRKMKDAHLPEEQRRMALELRRDYSRLLRTSRYMESEESDALQAMVKSELHTLRAQLVAGQIKATGPEFHALCLERIDAVNATRPPGTEDKSAFLKGCMYDVTDRCLHRFAEPR